MAWALRGRYAQPYTTGFAKPIPRGANTCNRMYLENGLVVSFHTPNQGPWVGGGFMGRAHSGVVGHALGMVMEYPMGMSWRCRVGLGTALVGVAITAG